jgi:chemotaxis protein CheX
MNARDMLDTRPLHEQWTPMLEIAAREVFELMLGCQLTPAGADVELSATVTSMVGLAGHLCGVLSIRCSEESATTMASRMLGVEPGKVGAELADALGEVANMVAGNFKNKITGLGDGCMLSVPSVIMGHDYDVHSPADSETIEIRLLFENKPILICLSIHA